MIVENLKRVFSSKYYIAVFAITAAIIFSITALLTNLPLLSIALTQPASIAGRLVLLFNLITGVGDFISGLNFASLVVISLLTGANVTLMIYRTIDMKELSMRKRGIGGLAIGLIGTGCPACGGLLASLGVVGGIAVLPFGGIEIFAVSILILAMTFYWLANSLSECKTCKAK